MQLDKQTAILNQPVFDDEGNQTYLKGEEVEVVERSEQSIVIRKLDSSLPQEISPDMVSARIGDYLTSDNFVKMDPEPALLPEQVFGEPIYAEPNTAKNQVLQLILHPFATVASIFKHTPGSVEKAQIPQPHITDEISTKAEATAPVQPQNFGDYSPFREFGNAIKEKRDGPPAFAPYDYGLAPPLTPPFNGNQFGWWRGIQGENNSCYMDSVLFALFGMNDIFDKYLTNFSWEFRQSMQVIRLRTDIVNELRTRFFVPSSTVIQWRRMRGENLNGASEEKDVQEFGNELMSMLGVPPVEILSPVSEQPSTTYFIQLFCTEELIGKNVTVQELWNATQQVSPFKLNKATEYLFLVPPRYSVRERILDKIVPSSTISVIIADDSVEYELFAATCIQLSHYVAFTKDNIHKQWYFFDSMGDRNNRDENVPMFKPAEYKPNTADRSRLFSDASVYFYKIRR